METDLPATSAARRLLTPSATARQAAPASTAISVAGTLLAGTAFTGQLSQLTTSVVNGTLQLSGTITGHALPAGGATFTAPIRGLATSWGCTILTLRLGAVHRTPQAPSSTWPPSM